nr:hypothetical protein Q903MT_gene5405 [Picea sitchensis]
MREEMSPFNHIRPFSHTEGVFTIPYLYGTRWRSYFDWMQLQCLLTFIHHLSSLA